jgi:hypothetical protein
MAAVNQATSESPKTTSRHRTGRGVAKKKKDWGYCGADGGGEICGGMPLSLPVGPPAVPLGFCTASPAASFPRLSLPALTSPARYQPAFPGPATPATAEAEFSAQAASTRVIAREKRRKKKRGINRRVVVRKYGAVTDCKKNCLVETNINCRFCKKIFVIFSLLKCLSSFNLFFTEER